jgi:hypothetical protein
MKGQTHGGKGSTQRPTDKDKFDAGWEKAFGSKLRQAKESIVGEVSGLQDDNKLKDVK